jgi:hypothetical protein
VRLSTNPRGLAANRDERLLAGKRRAQLLSDAMTGASAALRRGWTAHKNAHVIGVRPLALFVPNVHLKSERDVGRTPRSRGGDGSIRHLCAAHDSGSWFFSPG